MGFITDFFRSCCRSRGQNSYNSIPQQVETSGATIATKSVANTTFQNASLGSGGELRYRISHETENSGSRAQHVNEFSTGSSPFDDTGDSDYDEKKGGSSFGTFSSNTSSIIPFSGTYTNPTRDDSSVDLRQLLEKAENNYSREIEQELESRLENALEIYAKNLPSGRETIFLISTVSYTHYPKIKRQALNCLIKKLFSESLDSDNVRGLVALASSLVDLLDRNTIHKYPPDIQAKIAMACGLAIELVNGHIAVKNNNAVSRDLRNKLYQNKDDLKHLNRSDTIVLQFATDFAQETMTRLKTDESKLIIVLKGVGMVLSMGSDLWNTELGAFLSSAQDFVSHVDKNTSGKWYEIYSYMKELSRKISYRYTSEEVLSQNLNLVRLIKHLVDRAKEKKISDLHKLLAGYALILGDILERGASHEGVCGIAREELQTGAHALINSIHFLCTAKIKTDSDRTKDFYVRIHAFKASLSGGNREDLVVQPLRELSIGRGRSNNFVTIPFFVLNEWEGKETYGDRLKQFYNLITDEEYLVCQNNQSLKVDFYNAVNQIVYPRNRFTEEESSLILSMLS